MTAATLDRLEAIVTRARRRQLGIPTKHQANRVEDVEELLAWRESPEQIILRLHTTASALARALYRAGRPDLAAPFRRIEAKQRWAREARRT